MQETEMDYVGKLGSRNIVKRRIILAALTIVTFTVQNTGGLFPAPSGIKAMLLIPLVVCIAMFEREFVGMFYGLFAGALLDAFSTQTLSFYAIAFTAVGFVAGSLITYLMRNNLLCAVIFTGIFTFIVNSAYFLIYYALHNVNNGIFIYLKYYIFSALYTVVFTPLFYFIIRAIVKKFK